MKQNQRYTQEEMYPVIENWQESHMTKTQFCREKGIAYHVFKYWLDKYQRGQATKSPQKEKTFLPVKVSPPELQYETRFQPNNHLINITYPNGVKLTCPVDIDQSQLRTLIKP
jgi:transposase-like protein